MTNALSNTNRVGTGAQNDPVLATKCFIPSPRGNWIARPRLTQRLDEGRQRSLTLISAPAGFGKTTLLSSWIHQRQLSVAWLSLDAGDNDPGRFLAYVIAALETRHAGMGATAAMLLQSPQRSLESVVTLLINALSTRPDEITLVLDDYHVVDAPPVHRVLTFLLDHVPPQLHLILATRGDPPLPLARLRARGELTEVRAADLRFTADEASAFLTQVMGLQLTPEQIVALEERTEGWIAGLQLAALSLQGRDAARISAFIQAFTGSHHYIMDYLVEEVLGRQPEHIQTFLLHTSILDRLNGSLCDAVAGQHDSQTILERLERANLFLIPLEEERRWYRYHHLFADLLRYRLQQSQPDLVPELHRRASGWYAQHGFGAEAVSHALAARDFDLAAHLIEANAPARLIRGEVATLLAWLQALPAERVRHRPQLGLMYAMAMISAGQLDAAERLAQDAERALSASQRGSTDALRASSTISPVDEMFPDIAGTIIVVRADIARIRGDLPRAIQLLQQARDSTPESHLSLRREVAEVLGLAYWMRGDLAEASVALRESIAIAKGANLIGDVLFDLYVLGRVQVTQGQLHKAAETYAEAQRLASEQHGPPPATLSMAFGGMAELWCEWNDLDAASRYVTEAIALGQPTGNVGILAIIYRALARVKQAHGELGGALAVFREVAHLVHSRTATTIHAVRLAAYYAQLQVMQGQIEAAARWAREAGLSPDDELSFWREPEHITLARLLMAQGKVDEAIPLLTRLLQAAETGSRMGSLIESLTVQAVALQAHGDTVQSLAVLERALSLAEPEGYIRTFVDEGEPLAELVAQSAERRALNDPIRAYAERLLAAFSEGQNVEFSAQSERASALRSARERSNALVEPLSERELQVLRLAAAGASNREIAQALIVTVGTVKAHMHHIYGKLGVQSRTQAIARARALHLV